MFVEPLDVFVNSADFAREVTLNGLPMNIIFDDAYADVFSVDGAQPSALLKSSDAVGVQRGHIMIIDTISYRAKGPARHDGNGMARLMLEKF
jgi:hypothetical protein